MCNEKPLSGQLTHEVKLWTISQIAKFINDGGGTFRKLIYDYLNLDYMDAHMAGGMTITNALYVHPKSPSDKLNEIMGELEIAINTWKPRGTDYEEHFWYDGLGKVRL